MSNQILHRTSGLAATAAGLCAISFMIGTAATQAQQAAAPETKKKWESSINAGLTFTRGNTDSSMFTIGAHTKRKWEHDELFLNAAFGYGKTKDKEGVETTTANYVTADGQFNHLFSPRLYAGLNVAYLHDNVADISYRVTISPLAGYYFIKTETDTLNAEIGPGFILQQQGGVVNNYVAIRFSQKYEHKFGSKARVWEAVSYLPAVDEWVDNYIINAEAGAEAFITKAVSLRIVATDVYTSQPAPDTKYNDFKLIGGVGYTF